MQYWQIQHHESEGTTSYRTCGLPLRGVVGLEPDRSEARSGTSRQRVKVIGNWTDEEIDKNISEWGKGIEIKFVDAPGGVIDANGKNEFKQPGSAILINKRLAQNVENANSREELQGALLALMTTILHECTHWGRNNYSDPTEFPYVQGNYSRSKAIFRHKGKAIGDLLESEHGTIFENSIWDPTQTGIFTTKFEPGALDAFINLAKKLKSSSDENEKSKVPQA